MVFEIRLEPGGERFEVRADESILMAAMRQGIALPHSCRQGRCGTCRAPLVSGVIANVAGSAVQPDGSVLLCQARPGSDLVIRARPLTVLAGYTPRILAVRIQRLERLAPEVMGMTLKLPGGVPLRFLPGQHLDVLLRDGQRRSYSIASPPGISGQLELQVRRQPRGLFSTQVFERLKEKDLLRIEVPLGSFVMDVDSRRPVILLAGGTGLAPLQSMLAHCLPHAPSRSLMLYWGVRTRAMLYEHTLLQDWASRYPSFRYIPVLSEEGAAGDVRSGLVHAAVLADHPELSGHSVYASGPPAMIEAAQAAFTAHGLPAIHFHADRFEPAV